MAKFIEAPTRIKAAGTLEKIIEEYVGVVNSQSTNISIAKMQSPQGWEEPGQRPEFDEYTLVLKGNLQVETETGIHLVTAGQAIITFKNEWARYSSPLEGGAEYIAICLPAFTPASVHRDGE